MKHSFHLFTKAAKNISLLIIMMLGSYSSVSAFDTFWHFGAADEVGKVFQFSPDAIKTLKFSSFCLDYFGPFITEVVGFIAKNTSYLELQNLPTTGETHAASNFMHFDNLAGALDRNWKFDYLWQRLLDNTQKTIVEYYNNPKLSDDDKKRLILLTLGASLHMAEDFYSHSDWIHFNFIKMGFARKKTEDGFDRAPTWFEVRKKLGPPSSRKRSENWKFHVYSGVFPPRDSVPLSSFRVPLSHTPMNHDNSQLYYNGASQIKYHDFGMYPAYDSASAALHQLFAYHTACAAGIELINLIEENPAAKNAIDFAKSWNLDKVKDDEKDDLDDGLSSALMISCIAKKWDGDSPPPERDKDCNTIKILEHIHIPTMGNIFWGSFPKDSILQNLTTGFSDSTGQYVFDSLWHPVRK